MTPVDGIIYIASIVIICAMGSLFVHRIDTRIPDVYHL